jgi:tetratricopeptide (TPR) repeat protein
MQERGRLEEAEASCRQAIALKPDYALAHNNLGITLQELGRLDEAETSYTQAIGFKLGYAEAHNNLGNTLKELGRLDEAEASLRQAIVLKPDFAEAHYNLGIAFQELGRLDEAEASCTQAIALKPDHEEAHFYLGIVLQTLGRSDEAKASYTQAIALKPNYAEAHNNLGATLKELSRLDESEASYRQAIALKPDIALAHSNLSKVLYIKGYKDLALESIEKASHFDPQSKEFRLLLSVMKSRKCREGREAVIGDTTDTVALTGLTSNPLILNRVVEAELIANIYEMSGMELDKTKRKSLLPAGKVDARYGNGTCSPDFNLFKDSRSIIQKLAEDLTRTMMEAVKSDIYIFDSFFNILCAGGGSTPHMHLSTLDKDIGLNLGKQKYSLVYYLAVGDQNCSEPGILNLYDPVENILPCNGMIAIFPASRLHSAVYSGKKDRVMIGVNFYAL